MNRIRLLSITLLLLLGLTTRVAFMQDDAGDVEPVSSNTAVEIYRPQPITEIWGDFEVEGTANVPGLVAYQLEMLPLNTDGSRAANGAWIPVTAPRAAPVIDGWLDTVRTTDMADGLYSLRLLVYVADEDGQLQTVAYAVSPVRINNDLQGTIDTAEMIIDVEDDQDPVTPEAEAFPSAALGAVLAAPLQQAGETLLAPANGIEAVNMRYCDQQDNSRCPVVGSLPAGNTAVVLGLSANGSGWFLIQDRFGLQGWVSPTVVVLNGDTSALPLVPPPAPLQAAAPTPTVQVVPTSISVQGGTAVCGQDFTVLVTLTNQGNTASQPGSVAVQAIHVASGNITFSGQASHPAINPGQAYTAPLTANISTYYNNEHELRATSSGQTVSTRITPQQGSCGTGSANPSSYGKPQAQKTKSFKAGQCVLSLRQGASLYRKATHDRLTKVDNGTYEADFSKKYNNGSTWYRIYLEPGNRDSRVWVRSSEIHSRKNACKY